ncbi:MAG: DNA-binding NtrC family response regulator [Bradymonadia bacterium]|jgi:DNA-binding NtrC family response regulator
MSKRYHAIGWLARNNDPYRSSDDDGLGRQDGPTLTLLTARHSEFRGKVDHYTLLHQADDVSCERARALVSALAARDPRIRVTVREVPLDGPTNHEEIRAAVQPLLSALIANSGGGAPLVHVSPGTPAMHAVWLLLCSTAPAFAGAEGVLVESLRDKSKSTRRVEVNLPESYQLFRRYVGAGASADRPGIADPGALQTPILRRLYERAGKLAQLRTPLLLLGERGTGKSTLAAWIRHRTPRAAELTSHVWQVACGEFSPDLLASELFGHEKGAFTGAEKTRKGLIAGVGDDTLFLDEIADLDRRLQRQLIKVVEEGEYRAVGADAFQTTKARLVFATNHPEEALAERLDPDFLDRIGYFRLTVPPLRDCQPDHALLWHDVVQRAGARANIDLGEALTKKLHQRVLNAMKSHPLPGNLRDFYLVAYHLCAAIEDGRLNAGAVDSAVTELNRRQTAAVTDDHPFRDVVRAWLDQRTLDALVSEHEAIDVRAGVDALQAWFAREAKGSKRRLGVSMRAWSGVPDRTLSDWEKNG